ncbi:MAG TPA: apolipoprotein N-acyltransferase [Steroidobacteraceae bacterium]|nr:apolipoprotein N-acyltransferase [Steroidobacteraceae bacterium]
MSASDALRRVLDRGRWFVLPFGLALALAFAPVDVVPLALLCPAALFLLWHEATPREAAVRGFLFTGGTFLAGTYWLYHSIHLVGQAPVWIALFLMLGLVAIMGAYTALIGYVAARWFAPRGLARWLVVLPALWVLAEWVRGWFLSGFPWLALGYTQLATPLRGYAPVLGVYGVSLAVAITSGALATLVLGAKRERIVAVTVAALIWLTGALLTAVQWTRPSDAPVRVALVQGAVPQSMKWQPAQRERTMQLYLELTVPHLGTGIVVWPESAVPALEEYVRPYLARVSRAAAARGSTLIMGLIRRDPATGSYYNSVSAWTAGEPQQWYDKRRLVPFGEFFPVPQAVRDWLRLMNLPYSDFQPGSEQQSPLRAGHERLAPTVCYEDAYGAEQLRLVRESSLLVNVTNDAWFGDSTAPHQHLDISRMRSLESGRAMLRATNDGVTALIDHDGSVTGSLPQFQPGVLEGEAQPRAGLTPYLRFGNVPVVAFLVAMLAAVAGRLHLRSRAVGT